MEPPRKVRGRRLPTPKRYISENGTATFLAFIEYLIDKKLIHEGNDWRLTVDKLVDASRDSGYRVVALFKSYGWTGIRWKTETQSYSFRDCKAVISTINLAREKEKSQEAMGRPPKRPLEDSTSEEMDVAPPDLAAFVEHLVSTKILSAATNWRLTRDQFNDLSTKYGQTKPWLLDQIAPAGIRWLEMARCYCFVRCKAVSPLVAAAEAMMTCAGCGETIERRHFISHLGRVHRTPGMQSILDKTKELASLDERIKTLNMEREAMLDAHDVGMANFAPFFEIFGFSEDL